jgi:DNA-binding GntR family transcriptional regulator
VQRFSVSRPTVRQALADLAADSWIQWRRGIGTAIIREPVHVWPLAQAVRVDRILLFSGLVLGSCCTWMDSKNSKMC